MPKSRSLRDQIEEIRRKNQEQLSHSIPNGGSVGAPQLRPSEAGEALKGVALGAAAGGIASYRAGGSFLSGVKSGAGATLSGTNPYQAGQATGRAQALTRVTQQEKKRESDIEEQLKKRGI